MTKKVEMEKGGQAQSNKKRQNVAKMGKCEQKVTKLKRHEGDKSKRSDKKEISDKNGAKKKQCLTKITKKLTLKGSSSSLKSSRPFCGLAKAPKMNKVRIKQEVFIVAWFLGKWTNC